VAQVDQVLAAMAVLLQTWVLQLLQTEVAAAVGAALQQMVVQVALAL
jgi:hypothetical protein